MKRGIPVRISPMFWLVAALIGYLYSRSVNGTIILVAVIFVSILIHELGHALVARAFGQRPRIDLMAFGGVTYPLGKKLTPFREFLVILAGPFFGFCLYILASLMLMVPGVQAVGAMQFGFRAMQVINLVWTILNLVPVIPLDGGQLMRVVLEAIFKVRGFKIALIASMVVAVCVSFAFLYMTWYLAAALFFLFAFQNFELYRQMRHVSNVDDHPDIKAKLQEGERALTEGDEDKALQVFEELKEKSKHGAHFLLASEQIARLYYRKGDKQKAFDILYPEKKNLSSEALQLLHLTAFELQKYDLVHELSGAAFQIEPCVDVALRNALACSHLKNAQGAIGWLQASMKYGLGNIKEVLKEQGFDPIRDDPKFRSFIDSTSD